MSSPIKPPGSGPPRGVGSADGPAKPGAPSATERPGETFGDALGRAAGGAPGERATGPAVVDALREMAESIRSGRIDSAQALDQLVRRAMEAPEVAALTPAGRSELESHLRQVLADDPSLAALVRDLQRSG